MTTLVDYIKETEHRIESQSAEAEQLRRQLEELNGELEANKARVASAKSLLPRIESLLGEISALAKDIRDIDTDLVEKFSDQVVQAMSVVAAEPESTQETPESSVISPDQTNEEIDDQTLIDASAVFGQFNRAVARERQSHKQNGNGTTATASNIEKQGSEITEPSSRPIDTIVPQVPENEEAQETPETEKLIALNPQVKYDPTTLMTYAGFNGGARARCWGEWLERRCKTSKYYVIDATSRFTEYTHELVVEGLTIELIQRFHEKVLSESAAARKRKKQQSLDAAEQINHEPKKRQLKVGEPVEVSNSDEQWRVAGVSDDGRTVHIESPDRKQGMVVSAPINSSEVETPHPTRRQLKVGEGKVDQIVRIGEGDREWRIIQASRDGQVLRVEPKAGGDSKVIATETAYLIDEEGQSSTPTEVKVKVNTQDDFPEGTEVSISTNRFNGRYTGLLGNVISGGSQFAAKVILENGEIKTFLFTELNKVAQAA